MSVLQNIFVNILLNIVYYLVHIFISWKNSLYNSDFERTYLFQAHFEIFAVSRVWKVDRETFPEPFSSCHGGLDFHLWLGLRTIRGWGRRILAEHPKGCILLLGHQYHLINTKIYCRTKGSDAHWLLRESDSWPSLWASF